jgi:chromate transporter
MGKGGIVPVALGLIPASGVAILRTADRDSITIDISLFTAAFVVLSKRNPLWALATGTCASLIAMRLVP